MIDEMIHGNMAKPHVRLSHIMANLQFTVRIAISGCVSIQEENHTVNPIIGLQLGMFFTNIWQI
jgi:hypothetical protein